MLSHSHDKKKLIESMKKLAYYISNNNQRQQQIFDSISVKDLNKIINNLNDENQYLRRISALLICELLYNNHALKVRFCDQLGIPLTNNQGRITICMDPQFMINRAQNIPKLFKLIKSQPKQGQDQLFCWAINLDKKNITLNYLQYKKYSSFTFIDPAVTVFGIVIGSSLEQIASQQPVTGTYEPTSTSQQKNESLKSQRKRQSSLYQTTILNTSYNNARLKQPTESQNQKQSVTSRPKYGNSGYSISHYAKNMLLNKKTHQSIKQSGSFQQQLRRPINSSKESYKQKINTMQLRSSFHEKDEDNIKTRRNNNQSFYRKVQQILRK